MFPAFEIGDKVVVLDHIRKQVIPGIFTIMGMTELPKGSFFYVVEEVSDAVFPENALRFFDPAFVSYEDYKDDDFFDNWEFEDDEDFDDWDDFDGFDIVEVEREYNLDDEVIFKGEKWKVVSYSYKTVHTKEEKTTAVYYEIERKGKKVQVSESEIQNSSFKLDNIDAVLDAYNTLKTLYHYTNDEEYKTFAEDIMDKLKKGESIDFSLYTKSLEEE